MNIYILKKNFFNNICTNSSSIIETPFAIQKLTYLIIDFLSDLELNPLVYIKIIFECSVLFALFKL